MKAPGTNRTRPLNHMSHTRAEGLPRSGSTSPGATSPLLRGPSSQRYAPPTINPTPTRKIRKLKTWGIADTSGESQSVSLGDALCSALGALTRSMGIPRRLIPRFMASNCSGEGGRSFPSCQSVSSCNNAMSSRPWRSDCSLCTVSSSMLVELAPFPALATASIRTTGSVRQLQGHQGWRDRHTKIRWLECTIRARNHGAHDGRRMASQAGFEPATRGLEGRRSVR